MLYSVCSCELLIPSQIAPQFEIMKEFCFSFAVCWFSAYIPKLDRVYILTCFIPKYSYYPFQCQGRKIWVPNEYLLSAGWVPVIDLVLWLREVWADAFQGVCGCSLDSCHKWLVQAHIAYTDKLLLNYGKWKKLHRDVFYVKYYCNFSCRAIFIEKIIICWNSWVKAHWLVS